MVRAVLIQYKFILPANIKHSSYTYQKLFRAIYGYTQNVSKSSGKTYRYHRSGVLSVFPHSKPGKNAVLVPKSAVPALADFFKTGKNPSHDWHVKGEWKAVYYLDEKELAVAEASKAVDAAANRILASVGLVSLLDSVDGLADLDEAKKGVAKAELAKLAACEWVQEGAQTPRVQRLLAFAGK